MGFALIFYRQTLDLLLFPMASIDGEVKKEKIETYHISNPSDRELYYPLQKNSERLLSKSDTVAEEKSGKYLLPPGSFIEVSHTTAKKPALIAPLEGISTILKISFWISLIATSPFWLFLSFLFVAPALEQKRKKLFPPFFFLSILFFLAGISFGYCVTLPISNSYLYGFNEEIGMNLWSLSHYVDYVLILLFASGLSFELALLLFFLVHIAFLTPETMRSQRRGAILLSFILGALLTPPDILTQFLVAIPLIIFYELAILYGEIRRNTLRPTTS